MKFIEFTANLRGKTKDIKNAHYEYALEKINALAIKYFKLIIVTFKDKKRVTKYLY